MGFYSRTVFPWIIDRVMSQPRLTEQRPLALAEVTEPVLEIGFGTGLNLPHYPPAVRQLSVLDPNEGMSRRARRRIEESGIQVQNVNLIGGRVLPFEDGSLASVVTTWTLCSIPDVHFAIAEIHRVLKPGGRFHFVEHGLAPDEGVAKWQHRLNWLQRKVGDGCHLNRDIPSIIQSAPFELEKCEKFYMEKTPRPLGYTFRGVAVRSS
ncbi:MAG: class I SAM-dependent methyltransferase [Planctomycetota bacterium]